MIRQVSRSLGKHVGRSICVLTPRTFSVLAVNSPQHQFNSSTLPLRRCFTVHKSIQIKTYSSTSNATDIPVPSMGDSISEGTVVEWLKEVGDYVEVDDVVVILETDKVSVDVRSPIAGKLSSHLAKIDENVNVGSPLFQIVPQEKGETTSSSTSNEKSPPEESSSSNTNSNINSSAQPIEVNVPSMGDSISEGTIVSWLKSEGDAVASDDIVVIIETDKVSVDVRAPVDGVLSKMLAKVDDVVGIGAPLFQLTPGAAPPTKVQDKSPPPPVKESPLSPPKETHKPSKNDIKSSPEKVSSSSAENPIRSSRREKMSRMRLRTAERLKESQNTAAALTTFQEVDMSNLLALRKTYKEAFETKHGVKLGFMSAFSKASALALKEVPGVNATIDAKTQEIVYYDYVDISVAVSTPKGLVTPILRNVEMLSFADIEKNLQELALKARDGKLTMEDMTGGNFTISNGGVFGSLMGTPIINLPQSAILGMHATKERPVAVNGQIKVRPMMYLALTYDHRLIDGREAVTCLKSIAEKIENPEKMLLDL